jgi:DNA modification methylase
LDQFVGSGTTLIETRLLERNGIGLDINPKAINISKSNLDFRTKSKSKIYLQEGNALDLSILKDNSIDLICTHPPYLNIIKYSKSITDDLSLASQDKFIFGIKKVAKEAYRVLKRQKHCCIMMGDIRQKGNVIPLGFKVMQEFLDAGFVLKEIIIKEQHHCKSTKLWEKANINFLLLAHEYIFVFKK